MKVKKIWKKVKSKYEDPENLKIFNHFLILVYISKLKFLWDMEHVWRVHYSKQLGLYYTQMTCKAYMHPFYGRRNHSTTIKPV